MAEEKRGVEVFFSEEELAILDELAHGIKTSVEKVVYETVFRAHFTEEAKNRHEAFRWILSQDPVDWGADWKELKEWMEQDRAWQVIKSYGQETQQ